MVSPAYTAGLAGKPNELKLKFLADNDFADLSGEALQEAIRQEIKAKNADLVGDMSSEGTTPGSTPTCWAPVRSDLRLRR